MQENREINIENYQVNKKSNKALTVLIIITAALYAFVTVYCIIFYADVYANRNNEHNGLAVAAVLVLLLVYGSIINLGAVGCSIAGVCVSKVKEKNGTSKVWKRIFSIMIPLPILTEILFVVLLLGLTG